MNTNIYLKIEKNKVKLCRAIPCQNENIAFSNTHSMLIQYAYTGCPKISQPPSLLKNCNKSNDFWGKFITMKEVTFGEVSFSTPNHKLMG